MGTPAASMIGVVILLNAPRSFGGWVQLTPILDELAM